MSFTSNPLDNPLDRLRLITGDTDPCEEGLVDDIYRYVLTKHSGNEKLAALECLGYLVAKYASYVTEKAGGLFIKESEKFEQYSKLHSMYTKNPSFSLYSAGAPYAGGISLSDMESNTSDTDNNLTNSTIPLV